MASRYEVEVIISSAKDLKNVNWRHGPLLPYAVVWVDPENKFTTKVDEYGDTCPNWDYTLVIPIHHRIDEDTNLYVDIVHSGGEEDTKPLIGSARLKLNDVINDVGVGERTKVTLFLKRPSGRPQGKTDVRVTIKEPRYREPAYGVPPPSYGVPRRAPSPPYGDPYGAAQPPQNPYYGGPPSGYPSVGYNAAPQYGGQPSYGQAPYGQQQGGYVQEEKKKSKFGGMGAGLAVGAVAGVLGGLALSEGIDAIEDKIADDVADRVEDDLGW